MKMKRIEDEEDGEDEEEENSLRKLCIVYCRKLNYNIGLLQHISNVTNYI